METVDTRLFYELYPNFKWDYYLRLYPDVVNAGFITEKQAIQHYMLHGRYESRIYTSQVDTGAHGDTSPRGDISTYGNINTQDEIPVQYDMATIRNKHANVSDALELLGFSEHASIIRNNTKK